MKSREESVTNSASGSFCRRSSQRIGTFLLTIVLLGFGGILPLLAADGLVLETTLNTINLNLKTGVISSDGQFAYFGTSVENKGAVVKVRLRSSGGDLITPYVIGEPYYIVPDYNAGPFQKSLIHPDGSMVHFITSDSSNKVVHHATSSGTENPDTTGLPMDAEVFSAVIHPVEDYIYYGIAGTSEDNWEATKGVLKLNLAGDTAKFLPISDPGNLVAAVIDSTGTYAYFASTGQNTENGKLNKVRLKENSQLLETPVLDSSISLTNTYDIGRAAVIDLNNQYAYFAANDGESARILRINRNRSSNRILPPG
jgi:hypothetical protein